MNDVPEQFGSTLSRRKFIEWAGRGAAAGAIGMPLLLQAACTPAAPTTPTAAPGAAAKPTTGVAGAASGGATMGGVRLPTYVPFAGPKPDLAGNPQGLDPAFFKFPSDLVK